MIVVDIETRPNPQVLEDPEFWARKAEQLVPPLNYKDPAKIEDWRTKRITELREHAALEATTGIIVCIGYATSEVGADVLCTETQDSAGEARLLERFFEALADEDAATLRVWSGWNIASFDLPFLFGRAIAQTLWARAGVLPMPRNYRRVLDLYQILGGTLEDWMVALGWGQKKISGPDLLTVPLDVLVEHCHDDVRVSWLLAERVARLAGLGSGGEL